MQRRRRTTAVMTAVGALAFVAGVQAQETPLTEEIRPQALAPAAPATPAPSAPAAQAAETTPVAETGGSQVRIVRLSQVKGAVQLDRNTGRGFETAFANIPVIAGAKLRTGEGVAEVEFEDNSSLRLAPGSEVRFERLGRSPAGATETTVNVTKGVVYVGLEKTKGSQFTLTDGVATVALQPGAHLRLNAAGSQAQLAVFDGNAELRVGSSTTDLAKKQTVTLDPTAQTVSSVARGTQEAEWDGWDKQENDYHKQKASFAGSGGMGLYGANDLNYYGSFVDMPGCGSMWRPYFASAAWDPFSNGTWAWYPTAGYSWVSPYPWGWLPFHSGSWASCGAAGWGWRPGGSWYGLTNGTVLQRTGANNPVHMPPIPRRGESTLVPVNTRPLSVSQGTRADSFEFRRDSAGLGVPRATFGNLHSFSGNVERRGIATASAPSAPSMTTVSRGGAISPGRSSSAAPTSAAPGRSMSAPSSGAMSAGRAGGGAPAGGGGHR